MLNNKVPRKIWIRSLLFQVSIYLEARNIIVERDLKSFLDLGCGGCGKIFAYIYPYVKDISGVDLNVDSISKLPGSWYAHDLNLPGLCLGKTFDLVLSADCIEHILLTDVYFENLRAVCGEETIVVLSTPDASTTVKQRLDHKHFWDKEDFERVVDHNGFEIIEIKSFKEPMIKPSYDTTCVICKIK